MVRYCVAALFIMLAWLTPAAAWASPSPPLLAQTTVVEVAETAANVALSDEDINTFAKVYQAVQTLRLQAEQEMAKAVEAEGLTIERFNAIAAVQLDGAADSPDNIAKIAEKAKISKKEDKQFKSAVERIIAIRQSAEGDMEKAIEADGLSVDTFNSILERSADDTALQRQISDAIVKQTLANVEPAA